MNYRRNDSSAIADLVLSLFDRLEKLEQEMAELKRNSRNSSKPPSSDRNNPNKPPKSQRQRGKRKPGGQKGHPGHYLKPVEDPDVVVTLSGWESFQNLLLFTRAVFSQGDEEFRYEYTDIQLNNVPDDVFVPPGRQVR